MKQQIPFRAVGPEVQRLLADVQETLFRDALAEQERRTLRDPNGYDEMIQYLRETGGFVAASWCGRPVCEIRVKDDSSATIRCLSLEESLEQLDACICCGQRAAHAAVWAQAY